MSYGRKITRSPGSKPRNQPLNMARRKRPNKDRGTSRPSSQHTGPGSRGDSRSNPLLENLFLSMGARPNRQQRNTEIAQAMGLSEANLRRFYGDLFWQTVATNRSDLQGAEPLAVKATLDFYATSRPYGGAAGFNALPNNDGSCIFLLDPEFFQEDLRVALKDLYTNNNDLNVLDLGCGSGLSTISLASIIEDHNRDSNRTYRIQGLDINTDSLKRARAGVYTRDQIKNGYHQTPVAKRTEAHNHDIAKRSIYQIVFQMTRNAELARRTSEYPIARANELIDQMTDEYMIPLMLDEQADGYKVKDELFSSGKISYAKVKPFDLSSVPDSSQDLISMFSMFMMMSDEGIATTLKEALKKLKPGGYILSDINPIIFSNDFNTKYPKTYKMLSEVEFVHRDKPIPDGKHEFYVGLMQKPAMP